jgi:WD40 repeat protein
MKRLKYASFTFLLTAGILGRAGTQVTSTASSASRPLVIPIWLIEPPPAPAKPSNPVPPISPALPAPSPRVFTPASTPQLEVVVAGVVPLPLSGVAFSPDGKSLAVGGRREVLLWDLVEGKLARRVGVGQISTMVQAVLFSKDGKSLAAAEGTPWAAGAVRIFDLQTGQLVVGFSEPRGVVFCLASSPDGKLLVGGCSDGLAYVWNLDEKKHITTLKAHTQAVVSVSFSNDGKYLATASLDKTIQTWEVVAWKPDRSKSMAEAPVRRCHIREVRGTPTDRNFVFAMVVGGHDSRTVQVRGDDKSPAWARRDFKAEMDAGMPLDCLWIKDKSTDDWWKTKAYVATSAGTIQVFSDTSRALEPRATLRRHSDWVQALAVNAEGTLLASVSSDGSVKLWSTLDDRPLATLVQLTPGTEDWLILSGLGYFAASRPGAIEFQTASGKLPPEKVSRLQNPEMIRQTLAGKPTPLPNLP